MMVIFIDKGKNKTYCMQSILNRKIEKNSIKYLIIKKRKKNHVNKYMNITGFFLILKLISVALGRLKGSTHLFSFYNFLNMNTLILFNYIERVNNDFLIQLFKSKFL